MGLLKGRSKEYIIDSFKKYDINYQLVKAAEFGIHEYVIELLEQGASILHQSARPFQIAAKHGQYEIIKLFLEQPDIVKLNWIPIQVSVITSIEEGYINIAMLIVQKLYEKDVITEKDYIYYNNIINKQKNNF